MAQRSFFSGAVDSRRALKEHNNLKIASSVNRKQSAARKKSKARFKNKDGKSFKRQFKKASKENISQVSFSHRAFFSGNLSGRFGCYLGYGVYQ